MKAEIHTDNLSEHYGWAGEIKAIDELNLRVYEGETFGLLGPNGAGKTTVRMHAWSYEQMLQASVYGDKLLFPSGRYEGKSSKKGEIGFEQ